METHNIDSIVKKVVDESMNFYDMEANKAKKRIWRQVSSPATKSSKAYFVAFFGCCLHIAFH